MILAPARRPASRVSATVLAISIASAATVLSPLTAGTAYADTGAQTPLSGLTLRSHQEAPSGDGFSNPKLELAKDSPDYGTEVVIRMVPTTGSWSFLPNEDGSFLIRNDKTHKCLDYNTDNGHLVEPVYCDATNRKQNWYLQPSDVNGPWPRYILRNVSNNRCMDVYGGHSSDGSTVGLWDCKNRYDNQAWIITDQDPHGTDIKIKALATRYALTQRDAGSNVITSATYQVDHSKSSAAVRTQFKDVTVGPPVYNGTTDPVDKQINWNQTTTSSYTTGGSVTATVGMAVKEAGPLEVTVSASVAVAFNWSTTNTTSKTEGGFITMRIKPGEVGWIMGAGVTKRVVGTWTVVNDLGTKWSGEGTANVAVPDGTDGLKSLQIPCTSDSTVKICQDNLPFPVRD
ncbi:RICIN domain-containing protein [Streptomyces sp. NPDC051366]|uniref:RICIN domain-containing protein n=1 Tax=Streptomyces sp. NPDC051366 TaxID=3365652 RepID=UPI0037AB2DD2